MILRILTGIFFSWILVCSNISAQTARNSTYPDSVFNQLFTEVSELGTLPFEQGTSYRTSGIQTAQNHQYYKDIGWTEGCLVFEGKEFCGLNMQYNTMEDVLVLLNLKMKVEGVKSLKIDQTKINEFSIHGDRFINHNLILNPPIQNGFYQVIFQGEQIAFYIKHRKRKEVSPESVEYPNYNRMFIATKDGFTPFKNKRSFYALFPEKKDEIKSLISEFCPKLKQRNLDGLNEFLSQFDGRLK